MLSTTRDAIKAISLADPSITPEARQRLMAALSEPAKESDGGPRLRVMKVSEVADLLQVSKRTVLALAKSGSLKRVILPGRKLAAGFLSTSVEALLDGGAGGKAA